MRIDRQWMEAHIPHQGSMCLLDLVDRWSETDIVCQASSHVLPSNPLRGAHGLGMTIGIEYAAQAMAVHGALLAGTDAPPGVGFLTSVRNVEWWQARLDATTAMLIIHAERVSGNAVNVLYTFSIHADGALLMRGRAGVMLKAPDSALRVATTAPPNPPLEQT